MTHATPQISRDHAATAAAVLAECRLLAAFTEEPGRTTRRFLTPPVAQVHAHLRQRMIALGMTVSTDAIGNIRGLWIPANPSGTKLILGSHIDTVPNAGAFDGVLGVVLALEWLQIAQRLRCPRPIEIIAFSEEEGVRFGVPFLGSRAVTGAFDPALLDLTDTDGISMREAIRTFGLNPERIPEAALTIPAEYLEIHIEQGPVLESENLPLAVVTGITGQSRLTFRFQGHANHAGTTPMHLRRDALAAAAEWMTHVESLALSSIETDPPGLVATVGSLTVSPGASNVIPGTVDLTLDIRHPRNSVRHTAVAGCIRRAQVFAQRRGLTVEHTLKLDQPAVPMDPALTASLAIAVESAGYPVRKLPSGAGHDAMILAPHLPTAMLFLRSPGGLSHHPDETVLPEDIAAALQVAEHFFTPPHHNQPNNRSS
jgi:allantoate deiminase